MLFLKRFLSVFFIVLSTCCFAQKQHYYILFSARSTSFRPFSITGHAFITWRTEDSTSNEIEQLTYGFFPKSEYSIFKTVEGAVVEGYVKNSRGERFVRRFIMEVDSLSYTETLNGVDAWQLQAYNLLDNNCVDFMNDIALRLGLELPDTQTWIFPKKPSGYIRKLKKLNKSKIVKNKVLEKVRLRMLRKVEVMEEEDDDDDEMEK